MSCAIDGCPKPAATRGLCHAHYKKFLTYGNPLAGRQFASKGQTAAFLERAKTYMGDECLIWPFARNSAGYGHIGSGGRYLLAHRIVCEAFHGAPPFPKAEASHQCGNGHGGCVNGRHLLWKSRKGNSEDMVAHGNSCRGEKQHASRLTREDVWFIWSRRDLSSAEIARRLNVCAGTVVAVRARKTWRWLTDTFGSVPTLIQADAARAAA